MKSLNSDNFFRRFTPSVFTTLPLATIDESHDGVIELADLENGLTLRIPSFPEMNVGDRFHLSINGGGTNYGRFGEVLTGNQASIFVPPEEALEYANAYVSVSYIYFAYPDDHPAAAAFECAMPYRPVTIPQAVDGQLSYMTLFDPVTAVIEPWSGMAEADVITFYAVASYGGTVRVEHREVVREDLNKAMLFELPPNFLNPGQGGALHVFYSVLKLGRESWGPSSIYSVGAEVGPLKLSRQAPERRPIVIEGGKFEIELSSYAGVQGGDQVLLACLAEESYHYPNTGSVFYRHTVQADALQDPIRVSFPVEIFKYENFELLAIVERSGGSTSASVGYRYYFSGR